jgi:hypothetical protein
MEYLTLQDIPHRHCEPLHSRKMNSSHPVERPLANMVAAVSEDQDSLFSITPSAPSPPRFLEPALRDPFRSDGKNTPMRARASEPSAYSSDHYFGHPMLISTRGLDDYAGSPTLPRSYSLPTRRRSPYQEIMLLPDPLLSLAPDEMGEHRDQTQPPVRSSTILTESQNHHMRSSPPIQPGEQNFPGKLPSFSEVCRLAFFWSQSCLANFLSSSILPGLPHRRGLPSVGMTRLKALLMCNPSLTMFLGPRASGGVSIRSATFLTRLYRRPVA